MKITVTGDCLEVNGMPRIETAGRRSDPAGFVPAERLVAEGTLIVTERTRFRHRVTTTGEPISYSSSWAAPVDVH
jgi:hypothetical protein